MSALDSQAADAPLPAHEPAEPLCDGLLAPPVRLPIDLPGLLRALEERHIAAALAATGGNKKAAAELLGLQRTTLVEKLRRKEAKATR